MRATACRPIDLTAVFWQNVFNLFSFVSGGCVMTHTASVWLPVPWQILLPVPYGHYQLPTGDDVSQWLKYWPKLNPTLRAKQWQVMVQRAVVTTTEQQRGLVFNWRQVHPDQQVLAVQRLTRSDNASRFQPELLTTYRRLGYTQFFGSSPRVLLNGKLGITLVLLKFA